MLLATPATGARNVDFSVKRAPASLVCGGLATTETGALQIYNGTSYQAYLDSSNAAVSFTATVKQVLNLPPGDYRVAFSASVAASSLNLSQNDSDR